MCIAKAVVCVSSETCGGSGGGDAATISAGCLGQAFVSVPSRPGLPRTEEDLVILEASSGTGLPVELTFMLDRFFLTPPLGAALTSILLWKRPRNPDIVSLALDTDRFSPEIERDVSVIVYLELNRVDDSRPFTG